MQVLKREGKLKTEHFQFPSLLGALQDYEKTVGLAALSIWHHKFTKPSHCTSGEVGNFTHAKMQESCCPERGRVVKSLYRM